MNDQTTPAAPALRRRHSDARPAGFPMTPARRSAAARAVIELVDGLAQMNSNAVAIIETLPRSATDLVANEAAVEPAEGAAGDAVDQPLPPPAGWLRGLLPPDAAADGAAGTRDGEALEGDDGADGACSATQAVLPDSEADDLADVVPSLRQAIGQKRAELRKVIGERIAASRELNGVPQGVLAARLSYRNSAQVSQWELGRRLIPLQMLVRVAEEVGVSTDYLLGLSNEPDRDPDVALRSATTRALRAMIEGAAERAVGEVDRVSRLVGPGCSDVRSLVTKCDALVDAVQALQRLNPGTFDDARGGATLLRTVEELQPALTRARKAVRTFDQQGAELQSRLRRVFAQTAE